MSSLQGGVPVPHPSGGIKAVEVLSDVYDAPAIYVTTCKPVRMISNEGGFLTIAAIIRNAFACTLVAWLATYIWSLGNFFSGASVEKQSRASFLAASLASSHAFSGVMTVVVQAIVLRSFRFVSNPSRPPTFAFCLLRLMRESGLAFCVTVVLMVANVYLLSLAPVGVRAFKPEFYASCLIGHMFTTSVGVSTRHIIKTQTVQGQRAARAARQQLQPEKPISATVTVVAQHQEALSSTESNRRRSSALWSGTIQLLHFGKIYVRSYRAELSVIFAGLYVHLATYLGIPTDASGLFFFTGCSLILKIMGQEIAKAMLSVKKVTDIRTICVAIGLPTILIDTQVRIVLQNAQSTTVAVSGTIGLGLVEVSMRIAKVVWLKAHICRGRGKSRSNSVAPHPTNDILVNAQTPKHRDASTSHAGIDDFEAWERREWALHTAELYTDMSAEYMAIGCSTCILYFFGNHPKYLLGRASQSPSATNTDTNSAPTEVSAPSSNWGHVAASLGDQVAVEALVDFLSCLVETNAGTDFQQLHKYSFFVVSFLVNLAVASVQISGMIYVL